MMVFPCFVVVVVVSRSSGMLVYHYYLCIKFVTVLIPACSQSNQFVRFLFYPISVHYTKHRGLGP